MGHELDLPADIEFGAPYFVPSHLLKFLVATGVAIGATGIAVVSGVYAVSELSKVTPEEVVALIRGH